MRILVSPWNASSEIKTWEFDHSLTLIYQPVLFNAGIFDLIPNEEESVLEIAKSMSYCNIRSFK